MIWSYLHLRQTWRCQYRLLYTRCYARRDVSTAGTKASCFPPFRSRQTMHQTARKDVALILLQILDEDTLTDSQGHKVDFKVGKLLFFEFHLLNSFYRPEYDYRFILVHFFITDSLRNQASRRICQQRCRYDRGKRTSPRTNVRILPLGAIESFGFHDCVQQTLTWIYPPSSFFAS